jgi:hypothetical protein
MALNQAWEDAHPLVMVNAGTDGATASDGETCGPDGCAV